MKARDKGEKISSNDKDHRRVREASMTLINSTTIIFNEKLFVSHSTRAHESCVVDLAVEVVVMNAELSHAQ